MFGSKTLVKAFRTARDWINVQVADRALAREMRVMDEREGDGIRRAIAAGLTPFLVTGGAAAIVLSGGEAHADTGHRICAANGSIEAAQAELLVNGAGIETGGVRINARLVDVDQTGSITNGDIIQPRYADGFRQGQRLQDVSGSPLDCTVTGTPRIVAGIVTDRTPLADGDENRTTVLGQPITINPFEDTTGGTQPYRILDGSFTPALPNGNLVWDPARNVFTFTPTQLGAGETNYTVTSDDTQTDISRLTVTVTPGPQSANDRADGEVNTTITFNVLENDSVPPGTTVTQIIVGDRVIPVGPAPVEFTIGDSVYTLNTNGNVSVQTNGTPNAGEFTYRTSANTIAIANVDERAREVVRVNTQPFYPYQQNPVTDNSPLGAFTGSGVGAEIRNDGYNVGGFLDLGDNPNEGLGLYAGFGQSGSVSGQDPTANFGTIVATGGGSFPYGDEYTGFAPGTEHQGWDAWLAYRDYSDNGAYAIQAGHFGNPVDLQFQFGGPSWRGPATFLNSDTLGFDVTDTWGASYNGFGEFGEPGGLYWNAQLFGGVRSADDSVTLRDAFSFRRDFFGEQPFENACRADVQSGIPGLQDPRFSTLAGFCTLANLNPTVFGDVITDDLLVTRLEETDITLNTAQWNLFTNGVDPSTMSREWQQGLARIQNNGADGAVVHAGGAIGWRSEGGNVDLQVGGDYTQIGDFRSTALVASGSAQLFQTNGGNTTVDAVVNARVSQDQNFLVEGFDVNRTQVTPGLRLTTGGDKWDTRAEVGYGFDNFAGDGVRAGVDVGYQFTDNARISGFGQYDGAREESVVGIRLTFGGNGRGNGDPAFNDRDRGGPGIIW